MSEKKEKTVNYFSTLCVDERKVVSKWLFHLLNGVERNFVWFTNKESPLYITTVLERHLVSDYDERAPSFTLLSDFLRTGPLLDKAQIHDSLVNELVNHGYLENLEYTFRNLCGITFRGFRRRSDVYDQLLSRIGRKLNYIEICGWERSLWHHLITSYCTLRELVVWCRPFEPIGNNEFWLKVGIYLKILKIYRHEFYPSSNGNFDGIKQELNQIKRHCRSLTYIDASIHRECNDTYLDLLASYGTQLNFCRICFPSIEQANFLVNKCSESGFSLNLDTPLTLSRLDSGNFRLKEIRLIPVGLFMPSDSVINLLSKFTGGLRKLFILLFLPSTEALRNLFTYNNSLESFEIELWTQNETTNNENLQSHVLNTDSSLETEKYLASIVDVLQIAPSLKKVYIKSLWRTQAQRITRMTRIRDSCVPLRRFGLHLQLDNWQYLPTEKFRTDRLVFEA